MHSSRDAADTVAARSWFHLYWARADKLRVVTLVGLAGFALAGLMAAFGLPPVDLHTPLHRMGIMDPLCGGTRAARLTAQGQLGEAWRYNPLGILAVVAAAIATLRVAVGVTTRRWLTLEIAWTPRRFRAALAVLIVLIVLLEIRQQGRADLLLRPY